jgi:hypothetical protein
MRKTGFLTNKYTLSVLILICLLLVDVILHKGMSRVIMPGTFTDKVMPVILPVCESPLLKKDKHWIKAVDNIELMKKLPVNTAGIECDVYFDIQKNHFEVYHDSSKRSTLNLDSLLSFYASQKLGANLWFDFKNLDEANSLPSLTEIKRLQNKYNLSNKLIIESSSPQYLQSFCNSGFYTSYYVPFFNPYNADENDLIHFADSVRNNLIKYPVSALSGYYFQYPVLKKFFPNYPILTWIDHASLSVVSYFFKRQLENDESIKVILFSFEN